MSYTGDGIAYKLSGYYSDWARIRDGVKETKRYYWDVRFDRDLEYLSEIKYILIIS